MDGLISLLEQFKKGGAKFIDRIVKEGWTETLLLDFKTASKNSGPMQPDDRKNLAVGLSGFANSEGGILVWGVRADRATPDDPDIAKELKPISKLDVFLSDLWSYTPQFVSPPILNVEHFPIYKSKRKNDGFVITYVPKGEGDPHMSLGKGDRCYYCRSGSSFIKMEHFMVADRFHRKSYPTLEFTCRIHGSDIRGTKIGIFIIVGIRNTGDVTALYPALRVDGSTSLHPASYGLDGNGHDGLPRKPLASSRSGLLYAGGLDYVIYPKTSIDITKLETNIPLDSSSCEDLEIRYEIYSDGFAISGIEIIPGTELLNLRDK